MRRAVAPPLLTRRLFAKPIFDAYPFTLGVASGDPLPDGIVLWTRLAPKPLEGGGMPMAIVERRLGDRARSRGFRTIAQKGIALARPELGHSVHVEVAGLEPAASTGTASAPATRSARSAARRTAPPAGRRGRSPALRRLRLQSLRDRLLHGVPPHRRGAVRLRLPHRRLHLRRARRRRPQRSRPAAQRRRRSTRWSTTATATRSTRPTAI